MIRIGIIDFLNSRLPFFALERGIVPAPQGVHIQKGTPSELNRALLSGDLDVATASSALALRGKGLRILPGFSINSRGYVHSVSLFHGGSLRGLKSGRVAVTPSSESARILLRILLRDSWKASPTILEEEPDPEEIGRSYEGGLFIGDQALRVALAYPNLGRVDLGEEWTELTGTPMVFALLWAREEFARENPHDLQEFLDSVRASRQWGERNLSRVVESIRRESGWAFSRSFLQSYFQDLRYDLGPEESKGLEEFLRRASTLLGGNP